MQNCHRIFSVSEEKRLGGFMEITILALSGNLLPELTNSFSKT